MALRVYVISKLLWNPEQPVWPIIREFLQGVCGPAAGGVETYLQAFHSRVRKERSLHPSLYDPPQHALFNAATLAAAGKGLAAARRQAQTPHAKLYVDMLQNGIDYARLWQTSGVFRRRGNTYGGAATPADYKRLQAMLKTWKQAGVLRLQEAQPFDQSLLKLSHRLTPYKIEWLCEGNQRIAVVPELGGRLVEWHAAGQQWLMPNEGYQELVDDMHQSELGGLEPYRIIRRSTRALMLEAEFSGNVRMRRRYALARGGLTITSTLRNLGPRTRRPQWRLRLHLQPARRLLAGAGIAFRALDGSMVELPWAEMPDGLGKAHVFEEQNRPAGELRLAFANGISWTWRFDAQAVSKVVAGRVAAARRLGLDLRIYACDVAPGASLTVTQRLITKG